MKSIKLICLAALSAVVFSGSLKAQSQEDYSALATFLPADKLNNQTEHPELFAKFAYLNRNGYFSGTVGEKDASEFPETADVEALYPNLPEITLSLIENKELNLMGYDFNPQTNKYLYFRITGSDKVLVILPTSESLKNMNSESE